MKLFDTTVLIAAFCSWHQDHPACLSAWRGCLSGGVSPIIAAHSVAEFYSVLTRLPSPHRLSAADAYALVETNMAKQSIIALSPQDYLEAIADCRNRRVVGGSVYDALLVKAAVVGQAQQIATLNPRHFGRLVPPDIEVLSPSQFP